MTATGPLLTIANLSVAFAAGGRQSHAVKNLQLTIARGETVALVGESGSGKSVTSLAMLGLLPETAIVSGSVVFEGRDLLQLSPAELRRVRGSGISMIFQEPMTSLNPSLPVGEQVAEAVRAHHPELSRREAKDRAIEALKDVALPDAARRYRDYPHQFSGGQRQRILTATAIVNRPRLLIADEPTTALDVTVQAQILELLARLKSEHGLAMLFISHDLAVVGQVADRILIMRKGEVLESGTREQIFFNPQNSYTQELLRAVPTMRTPRDQPFAMIS